MLAAGALGAGGAATFYTNNEAGSVALVAAGTVFGVFAVTGQLMSKVKIGENQAEFYADVVDNVTEAVQTSRDPEVREALVDLLSRSMRFSDSVPSRVLDTTAAYRYEDSVLHALRRMDLSSTVPNDPAVDCDAIINEHIALVVKYRKGGRPPGTKSINGKGEIARWVMAAARVPGISHVLLVTNSTIETQASKELGFVTVGGQNSPSTPVQLFSWTEVNGDEALHDAVLELERASSNRPRSE